MIINFLVSLLTSQGFAHSKITQLAGRPELLKNRRVKKKDKKTLVLVRQCCILKRFLVFCDVKLYFCHVKCTQ